MRKGKFADEPLKTLSLFDRIQVFPLDVLNQPNDERMLIINVLQKNRNLFEPSELCSTQATFASKNLIISVVQRANKNRAEKPLFSN